ncbi:MAG: hypothetical protein Q9222_006424 [Ikaeria aurantiellina]
MNSSAPHTVLEKASSEQQMQSLQRFNPLPNPYPVPGRPFSLDFDRQDVIMPSQDVKKTLGGGYREVRRYIQEYGDGPIPGEPNPLYFTVGEAYVVISPIIAPPQPVLSYSDAAAILYAVFLKVSREGPYEYFAEVFLTQTQEHLGDVIVARHEDAAA